MCTRTTGFKENVRTPRRTPPELRSSLRAPHRRARHARYTAATIAAKTTHESKVISLFIYNCRSAISVCRCCHSLARSLTNLKECMLECAYSDEICARKPARVPGCPPRAAPPLAHQRRKTCMPQCAHYVPPGSWQWRGACVYISYQCKGTFRNLRENLSAMAFVQDL